MINSNLEQDKVFKKIKSLQFLYEINKNGRIVRNVKSKKHLQQFKDEAGQYYVSLKIKDKTYRPTINSLLAETWNVITKCQLNICNAKEKLNFQSIRECAIYISTKYDKPFETIRQKLKSRRHHIYDYDVEYLPCAETVHARSKEQETVHNNVYLTGSLDSWNDAKQAEEHDRVKHGIIN